MTNRRFSSDSVTRLATDRGKRVASSLNSDWNTLLVEARQKPANIDAWKPPPSSDLALILLTAGAITFETRDGPRTDRRAFQPGQGRIVPSGAVERVRWFSDVSRTICTTHIFIPMEVLESSADEYRSVGCRPQEIKQAITWFADPVINALGASLVEAARDGSPALYADTAALFLARHLLSFHSRTALLAEEKNRAGLISDQRLARVIEYMGANYAKPLTLEDLSQEAGISKFHFVTVFKKKVGLTPHRYLIELRLSRVASLLLDSQHTIEHIANSCGYGHAAQLTTAFTRYFKKTPGSFRRERDLSEQTGNGNVPCSN